MDPLLVAYWSPEAHAIGDNADVHVQDIQRALNKEIESWLQEEKKVWEKRRNGIKILLLGVYVLLPIPYVIMTGLSFKANRNREK
jgi:hypothetical protein